MNPRSNSWIIYRSSWCLQTVWATTGKKTPLQEISSRRNEDFTGFTTKNKPSHGLKIRSRRATQRLLASKALRRPVVRPLVFDLPTSNSVKKNNKNQVCHEKKLLLSIESWLVNRDPYFMVYETVPIELGRISSPTNPLNNQVFFSFLMIQAAGNLCWSPILGGHPNSLWKGSLKTNHPHPKEGMVGWSPRISYSIQLVGWKMPQIQQGTYQLIVKTHYVIWINDIHWQLIYT